MFYAKTRRICLSCALAVLTNFHTIAAAQMIFKCQGENGRYIVQGDPCAPDTRSLDKKDVPSAKPPTIAWKRKNEGPGANWDPNRVPVVTNTYPQPPPPPTVVVVNPPAVEPYATPRHNRQPPNSVNLTETPAYRDMEAFNQMRRCNYERQQLGVAKTGRPIYSYDNQGVKRYVEDANRQAHTDEVERRVAATCN